MTKRLSPTDYNVGIICALPLERTAVELMLDGDPHADTVALHSDNNVYTFGSIGAHNVVIASLDAGAYGTVSAAGVANDLRHSFPHIKYGLLVGIAGAMPRPDDDDGDLRLGDIVVGCVNGVPSIINYNLGQDTGGDFDIRSELSKPPGALSRAVSALEVQHRRNGPTYLLHLAAVFQSHPRMNDPRIRRTYYNHPIETDYLFRPEFSHISDDSNKNCTKCIEAEGSVSRNPRFLERPPAGLGAQNFVRERADGYADYPAVFLGTIGSADTLMRSADSRDKVYKLVKEQRKAKILCFEMEASGVVNDWPCLVIRGICDYSDSHKSDAWQNFAAITAAAYAKDLLLRIRTEDISRATPSDSGSSNSIGTPAEGQPGLSARQLPQMNATEQDELNRQFMAAAGNGSLLRLQELLRAGAQVNAIIRTGYIPTAFAAAVDSYKVWRDTLANPITGAFGRETLQKNLNTFAEVIRWLYQQGADFDALSDSRKLLAREVLQ